MIYEVVLWVVSVVWSCVWAWYVRRMVARREYARGYHNGYAFRDLKEQCAQSPDSGAVEFTASSDRLAACALIVKTGGRPPADEYIPSLKSVDG